MKRWLLHPSVLWVLGINLLWTLIAAVSSPERPWGDSLWRGESASVEQGEIGLLVLGIAAWVWITSRLLRPGASRLPWIAAVLMVIQLVVLLGEELDWGGGGVGDSRNLRALLHHVLPQVMDSPAAALYLLAFLLAPVVPLAFVKNALERASPVRAELGDTLALVAIALCWPLVFLAVGDQKLGELHQVGVYGILGVVTVRIVRRIGLE